ncbi:MAG TPA: GIY-YIG nuclease family protein [Bacillota bacterium]|nr:GIY-YIG nuclease family protein [Bacillota bacterium]
MEKDSHIVYMLRCSDDTLYTGYTTDLARRVQMHEEGKGAKYTRGRGPFRVVYIEKYDTKEVAMKREYEIKQLSRKEKVKLIRDQLKEVMNYEDPE